MIKVSYYICLITLILFSCSEEKIERQNIALYHWKAKAIFPESYQSAVNTLHTDKIYLHYFDIKSSNNSNLNRDEIFPTYVIKSISEEYQDFEIVPVVYITNSVFKTTNLDIGNLSSKIEKLINKISLKHFNKDIKHIQIDCDWTQSTRYVYFELLETLGKEFSIDATIRLHQIKFKDKTGIPPVKKGTLMLYNIGDLKSRNQNSILEETIVKQYIDSNTNYPLQLNIGLPIFSQTTLFNKNSRVRVIKDTDRATLEKDSHFKKIDAINFKVVADTLYKGYYLSKGYSLKLEEIDESEIIESYRAVKESKLVTDEIILYHLNEESLSDINLSKLIENL